MPSYKNYTNEQYEAFLKNKTSNSFGLSDEKLADWFMGQAGASAVINSYGVTKSNLLSTYIPKIKEYQGSASFFLFYTVTENGGAGNWINHYMQDTGTDGLSCLIDDLEYCKEINNGYNGYPVAMTAPELKGLVPPQNTINACQDMYNKIGKNTIGAIIMPSTMAGNAWVFAEQWCLDNQGPSAPAVYFGNPYDQMIATIKSAGVDPFKGGGGDGTANPSPSTPSLKTEVNIDNSEKRRQLESKVKELFEQIRKKFNTNVYTASDQYLFNNVVKLTRGMNLWKVKLSDKVLNELMKTLDEAIEAIVKDEKITVQGTPTTEKPNDTSNETASKPASDRVKKALDKIASMQGRNIGSGQCYALSGYLAGLVSNWTCDYSVGSGFQTLQLVGDGYNAYNIWNAWNWSQSGARTKGYPGVTMPAGDLRVGAIWGFAPNFKGPTGSVEGGGTAYLWTGDAGHTGVIESFTDTTVTTLEQNAYFAGGTIPNRMIGRITYPRDQFLAGVTGIVWWD